ncbi:DUF6493 family protein [Streptomyces sp. NPDC001795]|uniref:DUF7824 domain-containing protein n=1 Tax=Streptomyces sp. NPDC001795 TaxID=3154525 RepID=UPI00331CAB58
MSSLVEAVRAGRTAEVVSLLDGMPDPERRVHFPELKQLRVELRKAPWENRSRRAYPALHAAGAACQTGAAAVATWLAGADLRWSPAPTSVLLDVLGDREPAWLADVTHRLAARPVSSDVPYALMAGLVRLSGCAVPTTDAYVQGWMRHIATQFRSGTLVDRLRKDRHLPELVAALFEAGDLGTLWEWHYGKGPYSWTTALAQLTQEGVLERGAMVGACVARLLRGGSPADLRVFLSLLVSLELTRDEQKEHTADWLALTAGAPSTVASHAQSVLASLALDGEMTVRRLVEMSEGVLFRPEKKLVRAQFVLLGKVLRRDPGAAPELLPAVAQAFGHEDSDVQERALKLVERHEAALDGVDVRAELTQAAVQLVPGLRDRAARLLGAETVGDLAEAEPYEELLPPVPVPARLAPAPESAAELAEEVGALPASGGEVTAFERTLDGLVRHAHRDRAALVEALEPVLARRWWIEAEPQHFKADDFFRDDPFGLEVVLAALFGRVRIGTLQAAARQGSTERGCVHSGLSRAFDARLWEVAYRLRTEERLPFLLATPTWDTGLLEPDELVARLDTYRRLDARPGAADFAQALLRVRRDDRPAASTAAQMAAALGTAEGDRLARWLTAQGPLLPAQRRRTAGARILVELAELPELQDGFPAEFQRLGRPLSVYTDNWYCSQWDRDQHRYWLAVVPGRRELVAARVLRDVSAVAVDDTRGGAAVLPFLAEVEGEAGDAVHLCVAYGLGARHPQDRLSAVDALLVLAARGQLDAGRIGADLGELMRRGAVKPSRLAESIRTASATGAYSTVWEVLREALPLLLADLASPASGAAATPARGLGDLLAVAAECVEQTGARGDVAHLAQVAGRGGSSRLVTQARRLRASLARESAV